MPLLQVKNLSKAYPLERGIFSKSGAVTAVSNVGFNIEEGECVAIVGESGCGKTTLCRLILRLLKPDAGEVRFEGIDFWKVKGEPLKDLRRRIQPVFQDPYGSLNPRLSMGRLISEGLIIHGITQREEIEKKLKETLDEVGLSFRDIKRFPHEFSGGQRQRISLARAIILKPKLLVLDEPVSSLDVSIRAQVLNLLYKMEKDYNLTLLLVAHDLAMVRQIATRILVMYRGTVLEEGGIDEVYNSPGHPYTVLLLESIPLPDADKKSFFFGSAIRNDIDSGCLFYSRCRKAQETCRRENPEVVDLTSSHRVFCRFPG